MLITRRLEYALKGIYYLAFVQPEQYVQVRTIAHEIGVPKRFLEQIFLVLRERGVLQSRRGSRGGYQLRISFQRLNFYELFEMLEGGLLPPQPPLRGHGEERYLWNLRKELAEAMARIPLERLCTPEIREYLLQGSRRSLIYYI